MSATADALTAVFKAYDVRGTVPDQIDEDLARAVGGAFVQVTDAAGTGVVVGHDMRPSSPGMARAFAEGAAAAGADVTLIGLASTDQLYFASGALGLPGAMFTASHNPAQYNGIKMCRAYAVPLGMETGLADVRDLVASGDLPVADREGTITERDLLDDYAAFLLKLAPVTGRPGTPRRPFSAASTSTSRRCTTSSTAPSRTTRPTPSSPRTWPTCRPGSARPARTSGWRSTATPTAASSSTSAGRSSAPRCSPR
jgi:hypothetical protein